MRGLPPWDSRPRLGRAGAAPASLLLHWRRASLAGPPSPAACSDLSGCTRPCAVHTPLFYVCVGGGVLHILLMWIKAAHVFEFTVAAATTAAGPAAA